ncbi:copper radical oxidase [Rhodocollybia butyracea]|uniref:Copper radical oxidase n=1 Tax=Rhodocollybia butyracea TaxID=206335 RepID=A0A9P5PVK8_9AGAR|nr:copper radical oxidase [Rhodocollybia butyracea]
MIPLFLLALGLASPTIAAQVGTFADAGNTQVSAMMMFVGNKDKVYIIDKAEGNAAQINGHPAWVRDFNTHQVQLMDIKTNSFCASGMHLPNGSYVTFGGNALSHLWRYWSVPNGQGAASFDATYQDYDGSKSIRVLNPCTTLMISALPIASGSTILTFYLCWRSAGYINRNTPNTDPFNEGGAAQSTFEFYPNNGRGATVMNFMGKTSGLNAYAHTYLMASGKMLVQANYSTMLWDPSTNTETDLPDMPGKVVRVYPATGAVAMLPLTPANDYTPTDCQRITPEPVDGSAPVYIQDDDMLEGRTMGQFIILPDGKMLVVNGGLNGNRWIRYHQMPFGMSLASGPVGTPALYDPNAPAGHRWSNAGFSTSNIARLYHSSAILLPDASVLIAGSNPNVDVNLTTIFPTQYQAEIFYPPYFSATTRPVPSGIPSTLSYGGNDAAGNTTVVVVRPGWTTHGMNMGQRFLQLNNTFTVNSDGCLPTLTFFQPGPAMVFVVVNGIPSNGTFVIVGSGSVGTQPTQAASTLPTSVRSSSASGSGSSVNSNKPNGDP